MRHRRPRHSRDERGSALIITMMVMVLVTGLASTIAMVTISNLQSSALARNAGSAANAADSGVAQAISYLRNNGVRALDCGSSCGEDSWASASSPVHVDLPGSEGESYTGYIKPVFPFPENDPGTYRIHVTGRAPGAAKRDVEVDVQITGVQLPQGIFARSISGGGSASVTRESVFSTGCVWRRNQIEMTPGELDAAYGIPIGVHTSQLITTTNGSGQFCPDTDAGLIHMTGNKHNRTRQACNQSYPYDQDRLGGDLTDTACAALVAGPTSKPYPGDYFGARNYDANPDYEVNGSYIKDEASLRKLFNLQATGLDPTIIDQLKAAAQAQGNYWTKSTGWTSPDESNAVMYFDLSQTDLGGTVDLNDISGFGRDKDPDPASLSACPTKSLAIVIDGGNATLNSNQQLAASLFLTSTAPNGQVSRANGTADFVGTVYADSINLRGNVDFSLDRCFLANPSPATLNVCVSAYRELDRDLGESEPVDPTPTTTLPVPCGTLN